VTNLTFVDGLLLKGGLLYSVNVINQVNDILLDVNYVSGSYVFDTTYEVGQTIVNGVLQETMAQMIATFNDMILIEMLQKNNERG
jgi:hypothetical protein